MGRTLATFTQLVHAEAERWAKFRRALRAEDQEAFDLLVAAARHHAAAGAYASGALPFDAMAMAMLIELAKRVLALETELARAGRSPACGPPPPLGIIPADPEPP